MSELYHYGIKDMKWGVRRFQDYAGKLTEAGRLRYGVGSSVRGGVFDSSNTVAKRAKRLGKFGVELAKAKSYQYKNAGRYKMRKAKSELARITRGKEANKQILYANRANQIGYKSSRGNIKSLMKMIGEMHYKSVVDNSDKRFKQRMSFGKSYVDKVSSLSLDAFYRNSDRRGVSLGAIGSMKWDYIQPTIREISIGRDTLRRTATKFRMSR
jgi:hypothetical protein